MEVKTLNQLAGGRANLMEEAARLAEGARDRMQRMLGARASGVEDPAVPVLTGKEVAEVAHRTGWSTLVVKTLPQTTLAVVYSGAKLLAEGALPLLSSRPDGAEARADAVRRWFAEKGLRLSELSGIAAAGGFMAAVPPGTYRLSEAMVADLSASRFAHAENLAVKTALLLGAEIGEDAVLTTTDPRSACGDVFVHSLAMSVKPAPATAHVASLRAVSALFASTIGTPLEELCVIAAHIGRESSAALIDRGRIVRVAPCFGALPSSTSPGRLPMAELLMGLTAQELRADRVAEEVLGERGGLVAFFEGTDPDAPRFPDDARGNALSKVFAEEIATAIAGLASAKGAVDAVVLTGEMLCGGDLSCEIARRLPLCAPVVAVPGSAEMSALCAGLLSACSEPSLAADYAAARDRSTSQREEAERAYEAIIASRKPVVSSTAKRQVGSIDDIIALARSGEGEALPVIAIAGADNEEALLAAKLANGGSGDRLARFLLVGPYGPISELAWELDVPIDEDNFFVIDSPTPVDTAVAMYTDGVADIVMKGAVTTAELLKGYFSGLKAKGLKKPGMKLSHLGMFEVPGRGRLIGITDAAINPDPDLDARAVILESAVSAMHALGIEKPKVAVISATEKPSDSVLSSIEGQELARRFADRTDLVIEGPISVDLALSPESAHEKKYKGRIRGDADLLLVPTLDVGNAIYKSLTVASGATIAGAVVGGAAPIVLTSRGDRARSKLASVAFAIALTKHAKKESSR